MNENVTSLDVEYDPFADEHQLLQVVPSTEAQREIWASVQMSEKASCAFNESITLEFDGPIQLQALTSALKYITQRHDSLRTTFTPDGSSLCISESTDFVLTQSTGDEDDFRHAVQNESTAVFDLENGPLIRFTLITKGDNKAWLILSVHHIICDGWSLAILVNDLSIAYNAALINQNEGQSPAYLYSQYAKENAEHVSQSDDEKFWLDMYSGVLPAFDLPAEYERPVLRTFDASRLDFELKPELISAVKKVAGKQGASLTAFMLSAFYTCLYKWSGEQDLVVGLPAASQPQYDPESLVGHCVNFLPLRILLDPQQEFSSQLSMVSNLILDAYEHQNYTYGSLLQKLPIERYPSRIPLCPVSFNVDQGIQGSKLDFKGLNVNFHSNPRAYENFEIFINASDYGDQFIIECQYNTNIFSESSIRSRLEEYQLVLSQIIEDVQIRQSDIQLLSSQQQSVLMQQNLVPRDYGQLNSLPDLFDVQADKSPDAVAVISDGASLTYRELQQRSNQIASVLIEHGIAPESLVGICLDRSVNLLMVLLAILKAGAGYVPLDPEYPMDRLNFMIEDADIKYLITQDDYINRLSGVEHSIVIDQLLSDSRDKTVKRPQVSISGESVCYVIYTSGSTGKPKGVVVPHSCVSNFLQSMAETPGILDSDTLLAVTTLSFDIAVLELYLPVISGAKVVIATRDQIIDGDKLKDLIALHQVTIMQATPATWSMLYDNHWQGSDDFKILCGGEALPLELSKILLSRCGQLWNMYGPTETTVWSTCHQIKPSENEISIGRPIANTQVYIINEYQQFMPAGIQGELCIGGKGVVKGYHNNTALTEDRFIHLGDKRLYRTGDLAKIHGNGLIECLGRIDNQVKLRGFRIELGEIESVIFQFDSIKEVVVDVKELSIGDQRLVAYIVLNEGAKIDDSELKKMCRSLLPEYMIPQHIVELVEIPRTLNKKIDRKSLPVDQITNETPAESIVEAETETEIKLVNIWKKVLKRDQISMTDNFFNLGGHSLLANQIITRIRKELQVSIPLTFLFEFPSLQLMADNLPNGDESDSLIPPQISKREEPFPATLSMTQQRLWFLNELYSSSALFNQVGVWKIHGKIDRDIFASALTALVNRQLILSSRVTDLDGSPVMVKKEQDNTLEPDDFKFTSEDSKKQDLLQHIEIKADIPLDFEAGQYLRIQLINYSNDVQVMLVVTHPIIWDGWSFDILLKELSEIYAAMLHQQPDSLKPLAINYMDYPLWHQSWMATGIEKKQLDFWESRLQGASTHIALPRDRARTGLSTYQGNRVPLYLEEEFVNKVTDLAHQEGVTLYMVMLSAFFELLEQYSKQKDITVATQVQGRTRPEFENVIGPFVNTVLLRNRSEQTLTHREMIQVVRKTCVDAFNNQDVPFEKVLETVELNRTEKNAPPYQIMFTFQDTTNRSLKFADFDLSQMTHNVHTAYTDIIFWLKETGAGLYGAFDYSTELFDLDTVNNFHDNYLQILNVILANPDQSLTETIINKIEVTHLDNSEKEVEKTLTTDEKVAVDQPSLSGDSKDTVEQKIISIWQDALEMDEIEPFDNFFELGGHSLSSMQVLEKIRNETGIKVPARSILMDTLEQIVEYCYQQLDQQDQKVKTEAVSTPQSKTETVDKKETESLSNNIKSKLFKSFGFLKSSAEKEPAFLSKEQQEYEEFFSSAVDQNLFRGVYNDYQTALDSAPVTKETGYDHSDTAKMYKNRLDRIYPADYPVIFWLEKAFVKGARSVIDFGGHIGVAYYSYQNYINYPNQLNWLVCDVEEVTLEGVRLADRKGINNLEFTTDIKNGDGRDVFFASGSLQYMENSLAVMIADYKKLPEHIIVNLLPVHEHDEFYTLQNIGFAFCPYHIFKTQVFVDAILDLGYEMVDQWGNPEKTCEIPFHNHHSLDSYNGFYFSKIH